MPAKESLSSSNRDSVLFRAARVLLTASSNAPGEFLAALLDVAIEALGAERGVVLVPREGVFSVSIARNIKNEALDEAGAQISSTIATKSLEARTAVLLNNASESEFSASPSVKKFVLRSVLCAPVIAGEDVCALVYLENRSIEGSFSEQHRALLEEFCLLAAPRLSAAIQLCRTQETASLGDGEILTADRAMKDIISLVRRIAHTTLPVLIQGETGTGKELIARSLYRHSLRNNAAFVVVNCAALPAELMESELFGHVRGAFTGANNDRTGLIAAANRGTVFLDEIGELPPELQPKLLRVLQYGEIQRLGATKTETCDVRFVAATNRDLQREVDEGRFRGDLYFRIAGAVVTLPPLRERKPDVHLLAKHYLTAYAHNYNRAVPHWSAEALRALDEYHFPGNVRELESECARLIAMMPDTGDTAYAIDVNDLNPRITKKKAAASKAEMMIAPMSLAEMEKRLITAVLEETSNNRTRAAEILGISREGLRLKMQRLGLGAPEN